MSAPVSTATVAAITSAYADGLPVNVIAARHGVSPESVRVYARAAGYPKRTGRPGYCSACHSKRMLIGGFCSPCHADIPLTGGRWVPNPRGVLVWLPAEDDAELGAA